MGKLRHPYAQHTEVWVPIPASGNRHYSDVKMSAMASQITSLTIVYSAVYSDAYQRKHQRTASLAFVQGIHRWPVNSPHKWPVTRKMFPFDDVIMGNIRPTHRSMGTNSCLRGLMYHWFIQRLVVDSEVKQIITYCKIDFGEIILIKYETKVIKNVSSR